MVKRILVPLDGSALAARAIPVAARLARASAGSMLFLRVVSTASEFGVYMDESSPLMQEAIEEDLHAANTYLAEVSQSQALAGIKVDTGIFTGSAALKIVDIARSQDIDLIVMCSRGDAGIKRWVMGSVAHKVVRHSPVPVLVLRDSGEQSAHLYQEQERPLRVLVTLDGSPLAETALEPVVQLVRQLAISGRCHLNLLRVIDLPNRYGGWRSLSAIDNKVLEQARETADDYMQLVAERVRADVPDTATVTTSIRIEMDVPAAIIDAAEHGDEKEVGGYDLVAMATHGRGTIPRWALGSVTERVLDSTCLPLLVVGPQELHSYGI
ncbi:MAG: universal stress protein [Chloroflexota bacterium]|nr:universal stress protein [Chloroflexota bacterium]